jgi:hypothetical protein
MSSLPPIPEIAGDVDLVLDVYTHASLRRPSITQMNEERGDTDRLAELGANALDLVVTNHFYLVRPFLSGREIQVCMCAPPLLLAQYLFIHNVYMHAS